MALLAWWRWGKAYFWLPGSFWGVIAAAAVIGALLIQHGILPEIAVIIFGLATTAILLSEKRSTSQGTTS